MGRIGLSNVVLSDFGVPQVGEAPYTLTQAVVNDILSGVPETLKVFEGTPLETEFEVRKRLGKVLKIGLKPKARITYLATGSCEDFGAIQITQDPPPIVTGIYQANAKIADVGATAKLRPEVYPLPMRTVQCAGGDGKQKTRDYYIDWYYDVNINPGVAFAGLAAEFSQYVVAPCCEGATEGGGWFGDDDSYADVGEEEEEQPSSEGGGWFG